MRIIDTAPKFELRRALEAYLREELADIGRQLAADRSGPDA
jgi:hypothetical protein